METLEQIRSLSEELSINTTKFYEGNGRTNNFFYINSFNIKFSICGN